MGSCHPVSLPSRCSAVYGTRCLPKPLSLRQEAAESFETEFSRGDVEGYLSDSWVIPGVRFSLGWGWRSQSSSKADDCHRETPDILQIFLCLFVIIIFYPPTTQGGGESRAGVAANPRADVAVRHPGALFHRHGLHLHHPQLPAGTATPPPTWDHDTFGINNHDSNNNVSFNCYLNKGIIVWINIKPFYVMYLVKKQTIFQLSTPSFY